MDNLYLPYCCRNVGGRRGDKGMAKKLTGPAPNVYRIWATRQASVPFPLTRSPWRECDFFGSEIGVGFCGRPYSGNLFSRRGCVTLWFVGRYNRGRLARGLRCCCCTVSLIIRTSSETLTPIKKPDPPLDSTLTSATRPCLRQPAVSVINI
jgi:hypothetical protein